MKQPPTTTTTITSQVPATVLNKPELLVPTGPVMVQSTQRPTMPITITDTKIRPHRQKHHIINNNSNNNSIHRTTQQSTHNNRAALPRSSIPVKEAAVPWSLVPPVPVIWPATMDRR